MTDPRDALSGDLEAISNALPETPGAYAQLRALLTSLPSPLQPAVQPARVAPPIDQQQSLAIGSGGYASTMTGTPPGFESGAGVGVLPELFYGKSNMLGDPHFEELGTTNPIGNAFVTPPDSNWQVMYVLNSGTLPTTRVLAPNLDYRASDNPLNSSTMLLWVAGFTAACDVSILIRPVTSFNMIDGAAYMIAAARFVAASTNDFTNITSVAITVELVDAGTGTIIASSTPFDWMTFYGDTTQYGRRIVARRPNNGFESLRWQVRVRIVASGAGGDVEIDMGEPQQSLSSSENPPPYAPIIAQWEPREIGGGFSAATWAFIQTRVFGDSTNRFQISADGTIKWGGGSAVLDVSLDRSAAGDLHVTRLTGSGASNPLMRVVSAATPGATDYTAFAAQRDGDVASRFIAGYMGDVQAEGIAAGPGSGARDVYLYRESANVWRTDDLIKVVNDSGVVVNSAAGNHAFRSYLTGTDTQPAIRITAQGNILNGPGGSTAPTQVVTTRRTGWTAPTGTAQRGTFATDTVTLINLARAVKALIDDLTTHGLIGA